MVNCFTNSMWIFGIWSMTCRIGMSSKPRDRIDRWRHRCNGRFSSQILASNLTYDEAQKRENSEARKCGTRCKQEPGGLPKQGSVYSVYRVDCDWLAKVATHLSSLLSESVHKILVKRLASAGSRQQVIELIEVRFSSGAECPNWNCDKFYFLTLIPASLSLEVATTVSNFYLIG